MSSSENRPFILPRRIDSYGITCNGFLPQLDPLQHLKIRYYEPWEDIIQDLPQLIKSGDIRRMVDDLPVLSPSHLETESEWQRAYSILAFMAQGYIWGGEQPSERLPPVISIPLLEVSAHLEVPPVASYAAVNLWNWRRRTDDADITQPENLEAIITATGTEDESWFLVISTAMEARAAPLVESMLEAMEAVECDNACRLIYVLFQLRQGMNEIGSLLQRMDERCDPQIFYHYIRPCLAGSENMEAAGLPSGVLYDEGHGKGEWRKLRGGSNGQSSLIQFFDAVLGVKHRDKEKFHQEMRNYMPGPHAQLIRDVESRVKLRDYVTAHRSNVDLMAAFNGAVLSLAEFRNKHIQIATRYVILPARMAHQSPSSRTNNLAMASSQAASRGNSLQGLVGTGGTDLVPFLRQSRDETESTTVAS